MTGEQQHGSGWRVRSQSSVALRRLRKNKFGALYFKPRETAQDKWLAVPAAFKDDAKAFLDSKK
eukprot:11932645-Karenia_brevis.AAC.1